MSTLRQKPQTMRHQNSSLQREEEGGGEGRRERRSNMKNKICSEGSDGEVRVREEE